MLVKELIKTLNNLHVDNAKISFTEIDDIYVRGTCFNLITKKEQLPHPEYTNYFDEDEPAYMLHILHIDLDSDTGKVVKQIERKINTSTYY